MLEPPLSRRSGLIDTLFRTKLSNEKSQSWRARSYCSFDTTAVMEVGSRALLRWVGQEP